MDAMKQMENKDPEAMKEGMEKWMIWAQQCGDQLVDLGTPLGGGQVVKPNDTLEGSVRKVCGYSILQAESMTDAIELLQGHPHLGWDASCEIEIHESLPLPG